MCPNVAIMLTNNTIVINNLYRIGAIFIIILEVLAFELPDSGK